MKILKHLNKLIFVIMIMLFMQVNVSAASVNTNLVANKDEIKKGEEIEVILSFDSLKDIEKGINAYKATLQYDKSLFEEVTQSDFESLNNWEEFIYNAQNGQFVAIKKAGTLNEEQIVKVTLKAKADIAPKTTTISVNDLVVSEGKEDILMDSAGVNVNVIYEQTGNEDVPTPGEDQFIGNGDQSSNGSIPNTGDNSKMVSIFLFVLITIIAITIIVLMLNKSNNKLTKRQKMIVTLLLVGTIGTQLLSTAYAFLQKGELNSDGSIDYKDVALLEQHLIDQKSLDSKYFANADMNSDNQLTVTDLSLLVQKIEDQLDYDVSIDSQMDNYYPNKNQELELKFSAIVSYDAQIEEVEINGQFYKAKKEENTNNYTVKVNTANTPGLQEYKMTKVKLDVGKEVIVDHTITVDVLKDVPEINHFVIEEITAQAKLKAKFEISDIDESITDAYIELLEKVEGQEGTIVQDAKVNAGLNEIELNVEEDKEYLLNLYVYYDLDSNSLPENEQDHSGSIIESKEVKLDINYDFSFGDLKLENSISPTENIVAKNEPISIKFNASNATNYQVAKAMINGVEYDVTKTDDGYTVQLEPLTTAKEYAYTVESVILENGKEFKITANNTINLVVQKEVPTVANVSIVEKDEKNHFDIAFDIVDVDQAITNKKLLIKDENQNIIFEKELTKNKFNDVCITTDILTSSYTIEIIADYDITGSALQENQILYSNTIDAKLRAEIISSAVNKEVVEKGEDIKVTYTINSNIKEDITKLVANNVETPATKLNANTYEITLSSGQNAGKQTIELTKIVTASKQRIPVDHQIDIEVLKSKPQITNYQATDDYNEGIVAFDFELEDEDNAFQSGKVRLTRKSDGVVVDEQSITKIGSNHFEIEVSEEVEYTFEILVSYARDEDKTDTKEEVLLSTPIQMIINYGAKLSDIKTSDLEGNATTYFEKNEDVKLAFTFTNNTKFFPQKVVVNNHEYELTSIGNNIYETTLNGFANKGVKELKIEKVFMNNTKELLIKNDNVTKIDILKDVPTVTGLKHEETDEKKVNVSFEINDPDQSLISATAEILDSQGTLLKTATDLTAGENIIDFEPNLAEEYTVKIYVDYDLDTNELSSGENEFSHVLIQQNEITIKQELIELKDIETVQLFTKNENEVIEVSQVNVESFNKENYIAKISMKHMPTMYAKIKSYFVSENDFMLVLDFDHAVQYTDGKKSNEIVVKYGEVNQGIASNLSFEKLIELMQNDPTGEITLTSDLDAQNVDVATSTYFENFKGTLNGNGHTIKNTNKPLFNQLEGATINDLIVENVKMNHSGKGIIANTAYNTVINNVHIKDASIITRNSEGLGGFIGIGDNGTVIQYSSANNLTVKGYKIVGGMVGYLKNNSTIENSYIKGNVIGEYDAVGGITGQTLGAVTIQNCYADIAFDMTVDWAVGGIVGYSNSSNVIIKNNLSLARGDKGYRVIGTGYNSSSANNFEISESALKSNANSRQIKEISKTQITSEFLKDQLKLDEQIWRLDDASASEMPTLRNDDPTDKDNVETKPTAANDSVYIPEIERLRNLENYCVEKEIAYHNINLLMPFYDANYIIEYGNKIAVDHLLNTQKISMILPYNQDGNVILTLTSDNYDEIAQIKVIFENEQTATYQVNFNKKLNQVAVYDIEELGIKYNYNKFILNTQNPTLQYILDLASRLDYNEHIQIVTPEVESRLYTDYYNETTKLNIDQVIINILANMDEYNLYLDNDIFNTKIKNDLTSQMQLEKILYTYNYFSKWYNMEMGGTQLADILFTKVNDLNENITILDLVKNTLSQNENVRSTSSSISFFNNVIKLELGNKDIKEFLEYFMKVLDGYDNGNDWFTDHFAGILNEKPVTGQENEIRYRAWDMINARNHLLLPVLSAPQEDMYIISVPTQIVIGSLNRYTQHYQETDTAMRNIIENAAILYQNFYSISSTFIENSTDILNSHAHIHYDTRFEFPANAPTPGKQEAGKTQDPVMKWVYEAIGSWAAENGSGAYANGTDVYWVSYQPIGSDFMFKVLTHENAHNQDGYYFYEGYNRRAGTHGEDHADYNIAQDIGDGSVVFNLRRDIDITADDSNNLKLSSVTGEENINKYYREMYETFYVLDYLTGEAFLQLTPEEQAKLAVKVSYSGTDDQEAGSNTTVYSRTTAQDFANMQLETIQDLWDNKIALRDPATIGINKYGGDTHYSIYWYQPHNDNGVSDSYSFKMLGFEMLGYGGYDAYVTYRSTKSTTDLDALRQITGDNTITWEQYKMSRYDHVKENLENIPYFDSDEVIELYKQALEADAKNGNRNNTNNLRKLLFGIVKRATQDFMEGGIYTSSDVIEISTAEQFIDVLNSAQWGDYKITEDLDFSHIDVATDTYVPKTFVGRIDGNGHKLLGITKPLFDDAVYAEIQDVTIERPEYLENTKGIIAKTSKHILLNNVVVNDSNINLPFVGTNRGQNKWLGATSISVRNNEIYTLQDLLKIAQNNDSITRKANYVLKADLDLSQITTETAIIPGTFYGTIDGDGHTISNLSRPLFETLNGTIKNIQVENVNIGQYGENNVGAIARTTKNANLENISINNVVATGRQNISAVVGYSEKTTYSKISATNIEVTSNWYYAAGLIGRSWDSTIQDVIVQGALNVSETHTGGVIGASNRDYLYRIYVDVDVTKRPGSDDRNKNAGLYGAIETGPIGIQDVVVVGNMSDDLYKITPADSEDEISDISKYLTNVYELDISSGISNAQKNENIKVVTLNDLKDKRFYTTTMNWSEEIWDFSKVANGELPRLKHQSIR